MIDRHDPLKKFGPVWGASGVQGFFGEGYPIHSLTRPNFHGLTLASKTSTAFENLGNMPMKEDGITPQELFPQCVYVNLRSWWHAGALNAVALTNPGMEKLIAMNRWQKIWKHFFISVMAIGEDPHHKRVQISWIVELLHKMLEMHPVSRKHLGLQLNMLCPNDERSMEDMIQTLVEEAYSYLDLLGILSVPIAVKLNTRVPIQAALEIGRHPACSGLILSNTIPWDDLPRFGIDRAKIFGKKFAEKSPLEFRGFKQKGGYSGEELLYRVYNYIANLRMAGFTKHVNGGGGILSPHGVEFLGGGDAWADSFSIGSISFLRPWRVQKTIRRAYEVKGVPFPHKW